MKTIDARGLSCPGPVITTKDIIEKEHPPVLNVTVDNKAASENVRSFFESRNYGVSIRQEGTEFHVTGKQKGESPCEEPVCSPVKTDLKKIMVMITSNRMGHGDDELGEKLMVSFLKTLKEMGPELWRLVFVNSGVKLTIEGAEVLPVLKETEKSGIRILVCGTCLTHFNLLDKKMTGETTNMLDIVTAMQLADKVINI
ncbi:MAG: sulfurtransferase-like selenium metabolism protein YedF [Desulfobacteraceae bacterium]|nr:MAG: sulfurtransferase-like selenium metabolism protein YedF [Desulfobacteraceae bacterium]